MLRFGYPFGREVTNELRMSEGIQKDQWGVHLYMPVVTKEYVGNMSVSDKGGGLVPDLEATAAFDRRYPPLRLIY